MPLPYNVARVLSFFNRRIYAYDLIGEMVDYKMKVRKGDQYSFLGVLIPPTDKEISLSDEGESATANMTLYVGRNVELFMADSISAAKPFRQTFVLFRGDEYRVKGCSDRLEDGLHRKYTLVRNIGGRVGQRY